MVDPEIMDLDADIVSLLEAERSPEPAPADAKERVWEQLQQTLATPPAPTGTPDLLGVTGTSVTAVVGALVVGAVVIVAMPQTESPIPGSAPPPEAPVHQLMDTPIEVASGLTPRIAPVVVAPEPRLQGTAPVAPVSPAAERPPEARPTGGSRRGSSANGLVAAERALLDRGRSALREGRARAALGAADEHRKRFPRGRLVEERAALRVRALDRLGRHDASRAAARAFLRHYPSSIHGLAIERILGAD